MFPQARKQLKVTWSQLDNCCLESVKWDVAKTLLSTSKETLE
jgi:hypothetical protein